MTNKQNPNRRDVLRYGTYIGLASGLLGVTSRASTTQETSLGEVQAYRRLGRTELEISDISFGSSGIRHGQEDVVRYALDRGINYFDSAYSYTRGQSEEVLGKALKDVRDKVYIVSKAATKPDSSSEWLMNHLETSLRRLQTDYVDIYMCHAVNDVERIQSEEWLKFISRAKEQGKIRFSGMSGHAGNLAECLDYALDQDMLDVLLVAYNFGEDPKFYEGIIRNFDMVRPQPDIPRLLARAKELDVGTTVMKTLRGARLNDMTPYQKDGATFSQAAFRWVLSNKDVDAVVISMNSVASIDEYLHASGAGELAYGDRELLERYVYLNNSNYCRPNCNDCYSACPYQVAIGEVLRTRMYAVDYGDIQFAKEQYSEIEQNGSPCLSCSGEPCAQACTHGLAIDELCGATHSLLT